MSLKPPVWALVFLALFAAGCSHSVKLITPEKASAQFDCFSVNLPSDGWKLKKHGKSGADIFRRNGDGKAEIGYGVLTASAKEIRKLNLTTGKEYINHLIAEELKKQDANAADSIVKRERITTWSDSKLYYGIKTISERNTTTTTSYCHFIVPGTTSAIKVIHCRFRETRNKTPERSSPADAYMKSIMTIKINPDCFSN